MAFVRPAQAMQIQSPIHKRNVRKILPASSCTQTRVLAMSLATVNFLPIRLFDIIFTLDEIFKGNPWFNIFANVSGVHWNDCRVWRMRAAATH